MKRPAIVAEPESISDATSSSYAPRHPVARSPRQQEISRNAGSPRPLFDPRKDDPVRFAVLARPASGRPVPTPKSSGDWVSASSTSSYTPSLASSSFTLSSGTTDNSSASSAIFDNGKPRTEESGTNAFSMQLKRLYRDITALEAKLREADAAEPDVARVLVKGTKPDPEAQADKWRNSTQGHKK